MAHVRRGDLTAFEILYERHVRELLSYCNCILGSRQDAEDAVQSTFASAYRALLADDRSVDLRPWLFAIARNASLSILRKRRYTVEIRETAAAREDPVAQAEQRESLRDVLATMLALPEQQRTALVLAEVHGLSQDEIGAVLGVRRGKVKSYIHQARSSLISERLARSVDCREIREELTTARGAALLRSKLRRHLRSCEGCRRYAGQVSRRRGQLGILLPVAPSLALKRRVLGALSGNTTGAGTYIGGTAVGASVAGTGAELAGTGAKALVAKLLVGVAGVGVGAGAGAGAGTLVLGAGMFHPEHSAAHVRLAADRSARTPAQGGVGSPVVTYPQGAGHTIASGQAGRPSQTTGKHLSQAPQAIKSPAHGGAAEVTGKAANAHGKSAEAHGNGGGHGKDAEAHGKGAEAHGNGVGHGKSGEAQGKGSETHGKSAEAHGNGNGKSTEAQGNSAGPASHANLPGHVNGGNGNHGTGSTEAVASHGNTAGNADAHGAGSSATPPKGHGEPPAQTAPESSTKGASANGPAEGPGAGEPVHGAHEVPGGGSQKH